MYVQSQLEIGILDLIKYFFDKQNIPLIPASFWVVTNIASEGPSFAQQVSEAALFKPVTDCMLSCDKKLRQQAIKATLKTLNVVEPEKLQVILDSHP